MVPRERHSLHVKNSDGREGQMCCFLRGVVRTLRGATRALYGCVYQQNLIHMYTVSFFIATTSSLFQCLARGPKPSLMLAKVTEAPPGV